MALRIGIDFDNTIVIYDQVFHRYGVECFNMPKDIPVDKPSIRNYFWNYSGGDKDWIELQGIVYGTKMMDASFAPGAEKFLKRCLKNNIHVSIISHKTKYPALGPRVSLHSSALKWMEENGFFNSSGLGLPRDNVFFENQREKKLARIISQNCSIFIDDLPEVFEEPEFPDGVMKVLYDPTKRHIVSNDFVKCSNWEDIGYVVSPKNV